MWQLWHNTILHPLKAPKDSSRNYSGNNGDLNCNQPAALISVAESLATACNSTINSRKKGANLHIVPVKVSKGDVVIRTYALLYSGSDRTFCGEHLMEELGATLKSSSVTLTVQTLLNTEPHLLESAQVDLEVASSDESFSLNLTDTAVVDSIPVMPSVIPEAESLQKHPHLCGIFLPVVEKESVTVLIGNDFVEAHGCLESRFSHDPLQSPNAVLTPFGWMLRGTKLVDATTNLATVSKFLVRGLVWLLDVKDFHDNILTDEGKMFSANFDPDLYDKEGFMKFLRDH